MTLAGSAMLAVPADWRAGSPLGTAFQNTGVLATFRFTSGGRYTSVRQAGTGYTIDGGGLPIEPLDASTLPWFKTVDVRMSRAFRVGRVRASAFAEATNLLDFTNVVDRFTETNDVVNNVYRTRFIDGQLQQLLLEASDAGLATTDPASGRPAVDLSGPGVCAGWGARNTPGSYAGGPVDCVLLQRAERRFGNGDGLFTESEFTKAFTAWYDLANAPYRFYGPGRRLRVGIDISF